MCVVGFPVSVVSVYVHEATHWIMYSLEGCDPIEYHVFDSKSINDGCLGYILATNESKIGLAAEEAIAYSTQLVFIMSITSFIVLNIIDFKKFFEKGGENR